MAFAAAVVGEVESITILWVKEPVVQDVVNVSFREVDIIVIFDRSIDEFPDPKSVDRKKNVPRGFEEPVELSRLNLFFSLDSLINRLKVVNNDITKADNKQMKAVVFLHWLTFGVLSLFESSGLGR